MVVILVVDDEADIRLMLRRHLESIGCRVVEAKNGIEGVLLFKEERPALVIVDMFMPLKDGYETIREIRAAQPEAKIIAISGGGKYHVDVLDGLEGLGATATLAKPFDREHLLHTVARVLGGGSAR